MKGQKETKIPLSASVMIEGHLLSTVFPAVTKRKSEPFDSSVFRAKTTNTFSLQDFECFTVLYTAIWQQLFKLNVPTRHNMKSFFSV